MCHSGRFPPDMDQGLLVTTDYITRSRFDSLNRSQFYGTTSFEFEQPDRRGSRVFCFDFVSVDKKIFKAFSFLFINLTSWQYITFSSPSRTSSMLSVPVGSTGSRLIHICKFVWHCQEKYWIIKPK